MMAGLRQAPDRMSAGRQAGSPRRRRPESAGVREADG